MECIVNVKNAENFTNMENEAKKKANFNVFTLSEVNENKVSHWSKGLKMFIQKDGKEIILQDEEIRQLVESLPKTIGGKY